MIHLSVYDTSGEIQYIFPSYVELQLDPNESVLVDCPQHIQRNQLQATHLYAQKQTIMKSYMYITQWPSYHIHVAQHLLHKDFLSTLSS